MPAMVANLATSTKLAPDLEDGLALDHLMDIFVESKQLNTQSLDGGISASVSPSAVLPAEVLKNVCSDFNISLDIESLVKKRNSDGNGVVQYRDFAALLISSMHGPSLSVPKVAGPQDALTPSRRPSPFAYAPNVVSQAGYMAARSYPIPSKMDDVVCGKKEKIAPARSSRAKMARFPDASPLFSSPSVVVAERGLTVEKGTKSTKRRRNTGCPTLGQAGNRAMSQPLEPTRMAFVDIPGESCSSTEETEGHCHDSAMMLPVFQPSTSPFEEAQHSSMAHGAPPQQETAFCPRRPKTSAKLRTTSPKVALDPFPLELDGASSAYLASSASARVMQRSQGQCPMLSPRNGRPGPVQRWVPGRNSQRVSPSLVPKDSQAVFRPIEDSGPPLAEYRSASRWSSPPPKSMGYGRRTSARLSEALELHRSPSACRVRQPSPRRTSPPELTRSPSPGQDGAVRSISPRDARSYVRRLEPRTGQHVRRLPGPAGWDSVIPTPPKSSSPECRAPRHATAPTLLAESIAAPVEEAQRSKSWGQRVQLIEDLQEEVQRTRERVRLALAGTADRPLSSQADANSTELAVEDVPSTEPAPELVPAQESTVPVEAEEVEGYEDEYEFEEEELPLPEEIPTSTRLVHTMLEWGIYDELPEYIAVKPLVSASSCGQPRRAFAVAEAYNEWNNYEFWFETFTVPYVPPGNLSPSPQAPARTLGRAPSVLGASPGAGHTARPPLRPPEDGRPGRPSSVRPVPEAERRPLGGGGAPPPPLSPLSLSGPKRRSASAAPHRLSIVTRPPGAP
eukprot:EG_transcript_3002